MVNLLDLFEVVLVAAVWTAIIQVLERRGILAKRNLVAMGPFLMVKTRRGRDFIDRTSRFRRVWRAFGDLSIVIVGLTMVGITALLVWEATLVGNIPPDRAPSPELLLGIPGLNPVIPLGYGICAFVEPAEAEMKELPRRERARIYSVGAGINILLALLFGVLFSSMMLSVQPVAPGVGIVASSSETSPASVAGIPVGSIITSVNGTATPTPAILRAVTARSQPGDDVTVVAWKNGASQTYTVRLGNDSGVPILGIRGLNTQTSIYHPFTDVDAYGGVPGSLLTYISLPFIGYAPLQPPLTDFYVITGPWGAVPASVFYLLANALYWLFWLNLMLGATNALPAVPLDGGFVFKDGVEALLARARKGLAPERRERVVRTGSYAVAVLILALILWQFIGPRF